MLNRVAWALSRLSTHAEMPDGTTVDGEHAHDFTTQARAALLAIREPSGAVMDAADEATLEGRCYFDIAWPAMIDAILNEKPEGAAERTMNRPDLDQINQFPPGKPPGWVDGGSPHRASVPTPAPHLLTAD